jgi:hypothetical protein
METHNTHLNKKVDYLQEKQRKQTKTPHNQEKQQIYPRIKNSNQHQIHQGRNRNTQLRVAT